MLAKYRGEALSLICCLVLVLLGSCTKGKFEVEFDITDNPITTYRLYYYASTKKQGLYISQEVFLKDGKGELICAAGNPALVFISPPDNTQPLLAFYACKGDKIRITGKGTDPVMWDVDGNDINKRWTQWRHENVMQFHNGAEGINIAVEQYVKAHPDDKLSAFLLLCEYRRTNSDGKFRTLWMGLNEKIRNKEMYDMLARTDLLEAPVAPRADKMIVRSLVNGVDTLKMRDVPTILYFWHNGQVERRMGIDTLRNLLCDYQDSTTRIIADIGMDPDSLAWVAPLRVDSLRGSVRGWMPFGFADEWAIKAQPEETPSFMVVDRKGKIIYSGRDAHQASCAFRGLMKGSGKR